MLEPIEPIPPEKRKFVFKSLEKPIKAGLPWPCSGIPRLSQAQQLSSIGASSLCEVCEGITLSALESPDGYTYTGEALERSGSVSNACRLCALIFKTLKESYIDMVQDVNADVIMSDCETEKAFSEILNVTGQCITLFAFADSDIALVPKPQFLETDGGLPPLLTLYNPSGSSSTGLTKYAVPSATKTEAVSLVSHWLSECFATHPECPKTFESPLPKRLIDVGRLGDASDSVRLWINPCSTNEGDGYRGPHGRYVALTYCWGTRAFTTLTPERQASMVNGISMADVPQTICDAICITRLLGIRYIWVDSLCIFQGTSAQARKDWREQSRQMSNVYKHATLTIGSETSRNAYQGFDHAESSIHELFALLPTKWSSSSTHSPIFVGPDAAQAVAPFSKLHTRGWTFQERLLSTRYVTFGSGGIFWECLHGRQYDNACLEVFYDGDLCPKLPRAPTFWDWSLIAAEFSRKQLTKAEDRLVAMDGLRAHFLHLRGAQDTDLAGLWGSNLSWDLLWTFGIREDKSAKDLSMNTPSWSWTSTGYSVNWSISYSYHSWHVCHTECAAILDVTANSISTTLEEKIEGIINIRGFSSKVTWIARTGRSGMVTIVDELGNTAVAEMDKERSYSTELSLIRETGHVPNLLFCAQFHNNPGYIGLLVESTDETRTEFRRLGIYRSSDPFTSKPDKPVTIGIV